MVITTTKEVPEELLFSMEALMVNEFRSLQSLRTITQDERQILLDGNGNALMPLIEKKEALLDEINRLEVTRRTLADKIAQLSGIGEIKNLSDLLNQVNLSASERIIRLRDGILALQGEIRELNRGNYALATLNLERLGALQGFIVNLFTTSSFYQPISTAPAVQQSANWGMDQRA